MHVLHIDSSLNGEQSISRQLTAGIVTGLKDSFDPDVRRAALEGALAA